MGWDSGEREFVSRSGISCLIIGNRRPNYGQFCLYGISGRWHFFTLNIFKISMNGDEMKNMIEMETKWKHKKYEFFSISEDFRQINYFSFQFYKNQNIIFSLDSPYDRHSTRPNSSSDICSNMSVHPSETVVIVCQFSSDCFSGCHL